MTVDGQRPRASVRLAGAGLGVLLGAGLAFRLSPRPSVSLLRRLGERGRRELDARVAANVSLEPAGVATIELDASYGPAPTHHLDVFAPEGRAPRPAVLWVHGGGFIGGTKEEIRPYLRVLAGRGFTTIGVEYTLAPAATYPTPVLEVAAALEHVLAHADRYGVDPNRIVLAGDSAGAHIAGQLGFAIVDADYAAATGVPRPMSAEHLRALILASGVFDLTIGADARGLPGWIVRTLLWAYSGVRSPFGDERFSHASLVEHVPTALPPVYLTAGNEDALRAHTTRFARALTEAGVEVVDDTVDADHEPGLPHDYQMDLRLDRAIRSLDRIAELVRRTIGP